MIEKSKIDKSRFWKRKKLGNRKIDKSNDQQFQSRNRKNRITKIVKNRINEKKGKLEKSNIRNLEKSKNQETETLTNR